MRCNSFEIEADNITTYSVKLSPDVPSQQGALFRQVLGAARERITAIVGNYMVFGTQLVGALKKDKAEVTGVEHEGKS